MPVLIRSARAILLEPSLAEADLMGICLDLIDRNGQQEAEIYLQLTRGVAPRSLQIPTGATPSLLVADQTAATGRTDALRQDGVSMITSERMIAGLIAISNPPPCWPTC